MDTSLAHENARLRALLQTQQDTIRQMAEYTRLLSQRVAAYASEINRLKALVAKLQRMQFGKSSEKSRKSGCVTSLSISRTGRQTGYAICCPGKLI